MQTMASFLGRLKSRTNVFNLPNCITVFRVAIVPVMGVFLAFEGEHPPLELDYTFRYAPGKIATLFVIIAGISDLLDGYFARKWKIESLLGKFLDPVADKVFVLVGLVLLLQLGRVPATLVIILLSREFLVTALRGVAAGEGLIIAAGSSGKFKQTIQMVGLGFLMWHGSAFGFSAHKIGIILLYVAVVFSLFSGYEYLRDFFAARAKKVL